MTERLGVVCLFCGEPVDPGDEFTWHRVEGWERKASGDSRRSGRDVKLTKRIGGWAHPHCIDREANGVNARQETLV